MVFEQTDNVSSGNCDNVQTSFAHTAHVEHENVQFEQTQTQSQSQWQSNDNNNNPNTQSVEHESNEIYDDSCDYHEQYHQPDESQQQSHSEHQYTHEQSIIESTNPCSLPDEIVSASNEHFSAHEIPSNDNFVPSQIGDHSEPSSNDNDQVRKLFHRCIQMVHATKIAF